MNAPSNIVRSKAPNVLMRPFNARALYCEDFYSESSLVFNETGRDRGCDVTDRSSSFRTFPIIHNRDLTSTLM
jgi:hypothetical protein